MYQPLDLKYRPKKFSEVIGNDSIVKLLLTRSRGGTLTGRSMMFGGPKGCGKTTLARIVARAIVCDYLNDGEPCCECDSCESISDESSTSFDEYDAATQGTVDRVRALIQDLDYGSMDGKPRVVILDEAHRLSKSSQDALLKSMEDRRLVVILCTTEPRKIVDAIRSRVEEYSVSPPSDQVLVTHLGNICKSENIQFEPEALFIISQSLNNCPRQCVCAIDTLVTAGGVSVENTRQLFKHDSTQYIVNVLSTINSSYASSLSWLDKLSSESPTWIRDTMISAITSAIRQGIGARSNFPVPTEFFGIRGFEWAKLARELGTIDKPNLFNIEAALLGFIKDVPDNHISESIINDNLVRLPTQSVPIVELPSITVHNSDSNNKVHNGTKNGMVDQVVERLVEPKNSIPVHMPSKSLEVDGVKFSSDESLTSLDSKIEKGSSGPPPAPEQNFARVEYDKRYVPLPEKEFASGLINRIKGNR